MLVDCYDVAPPVGDQSVDGTEAVLVKTIRLADGPRSTSPKPAASPLQRGLPHKPQSPLSPSQHALAAKKRVGTLRDVQRQLRIVLRIRDSDELGRLDALIDKWRQAGLDMLRQLRTEAISSGALDERRVCQLSEPSLAHALGLPVDTIRALFPDAFQLGDD